MELQNHFENIRQIIRQGRIKALQAAYTEQLKVYWNVGAYVHQKLDAASWGVKVVDTLANWLKENEPGLKGFDRRTLYRMIKIIGEVQSGLISIRAACIKYGLCRRTYRHWITRLSVRNLGNELSTQLFSGMTEEKKSKVTDRKIKELTQALELARLKIDSLETMIKVVEEDLHIKIRKKRGTKQSKE